MSGVPTDAGPVAAWDVPRDGPSPPFLSPAAWRARNDASLARKVEIIVAAVHDPSLSPPGGIRTNHKTLRAWSDPGRRLWSWEGREVDDKNGRNKEVVAKLHDAWRALTEAEPSRKAAHRQPGLRKQLDAALKQIDALLAQLVVVMRERNGRGPVPEADKR